MRGRELRKKRKREEERAVCTPVRFCFSLAMSACQSKVERVIGAIESCEQNNGATAVYTGEILFKDQRRGLLAWLAQLRCRTHLFVR